MEMSLKKQVLVETVQLLTKKIIYVRRVRPKAMGLRLWRAILATLAGITIQRRVV